MNISCMCTDDMRKRKVFKFKTIHNVGYPNKICTLYTIVCQRKASTAGIFIFLSSQLENHMRSYSDKRGNLGIILVHRNSRVQQLEFYVWF